MKLILSVVSLLVVVAIVMLVARQQLHAVSGSGSAGRMAAGASAADVTAPPALTGSGSPRNIEQQFKDATTQALQQGAQRASDPNE